MDGFKVADAYVDVHAKLADPEIRAAAQQAGDSAGAAMGDSTAKSFEGRLRDSRGRFVAAGNDGGDGVTDGITQGVKKGAPRITGIFADILPRALTNPYVLGGLAAAAALLSPAIGAGIAGGLIAGGGLGVIGLGAFLLKEEPAVKAAAKSLGDSVKSIFGQAARPMIQPFVDALGILKNTLVGAGPQIKAMFASVAPAIVPFAQGLADMVKNALPGFLSLIQQAGPLLTKIAPSLAKLGEGIGAFFQHVSNGAPGATKFLQDFLAGTAGLLTGLGQLIEWLSIAYEAIHNFFVNIPGWASSAWAGVMTFIHGIGNFFTSLAGWVAQGYNAVIGFFAGIGSGVINFVNTSLATIRGWGSTIVNFFVNTWNTVSSGVANFFNTLGAWFAALPGRIGSFLAALPGVLLSAFGAAINAALYAVGYGIGSIIAFFRDAPGKIYNALISLVGFVSNVFTSAKDAAINLVTNLITSVVNWFAQLPGRAGSALASLWGSISGAFNTARSNAINFVTNLVNGVINWFAQLPGRARSALSSLWGSISGAFSSAVSGARQKAQELVDGAINFLRTLPGKALAALRSVRDSVLGAFAGAGSWLLDAGRQIINGLIGGIKGAIGGAISAVKNGVSSIINGAKSALGIGSPSKVFRDEVGRWLFPGMVKGMERTIPATQRAMADGLSRTLPGVPAIGASGSAGHTAGASGNGTTVHIGTVTLDASKMRTIQDVVDLITNLVPTARAARAATTYGGF